MAFQSISFQRRPICFQLDLHDPNENNSADKSNYQVVMDDSFMMVDGGWNVYFAIIDDGLCIRT